MPLLFNSVTQRSRVDAKPEKLFFICSARLNTESPRHPRELHLQREQKMDSAAFPGAINISLFQLPVTQRLTPLSE